MTKKTLAFFLFISFYFTNAQQTINNAADTICSCVTSKLKYLDDVQNEQKDAFLYICTTDFFNNNLAGILKQYGITTLLEGTFDRFSKETNEYLSNNCPNVLPTKATQENELTTAVIEPTSPKIESVIECIVLNIANYQYPTIEGRDENGNIESYIIYKSFSTDILFTAGGIKVGNKIKISYQIEDIYDSSSKRFKPYKVITQLEKRR